MLPIDSTYSELESRAVQFSSCAVNKPLFTLTRSQVVGARTKWPADDATRDIRMSVVQGRQLVHLLGQLRMLVVVAMVMVMRLVTIVAAWTTPTVAVGVATVRWTVLLVYQVLYERHDRLAFVRHRLNTHTRANCIIIIIITISIIYPR